MRAVEDFGACKNSPFQSSAHTAELMLKVGTTGFDDALAAAGFALIGAEHVSAFVLSDGGPMLLAASSRNNGTSARVAAASYLRNGYWRNDPALRWHEARGTRRRAAHRMSATLVAATEIEDSRYRRDCYAIPDATQKTSIFREMPRQTIVLNLYRGRRQSVNADLLLDTLSTAAEFLTCAVAKQHELMARQAGLGPQRLPSLEALALRLSHIEHSLTSRELEVCSRILLGLSAHAIAEELAIAVSSVVTYRRRAYDKLGISCQQELFRFCL